MPKINEYPLQESLTGDELFVVETEDGTKKLSSETILAQFTDEINKLWVISGKSQHPRAWIYNGANGSGTGTVEFRDMNGSIIMPQIGFGTGADTAGYDATTQLELYNVGTDITLYVYATFEGSAKVRCTCTEIRSDGTTALIGSFILEDGSNIQGDSLGLFHSTLDPSIDIEIRITDA